MAFLTVRRKKSYNGQKATDEAVYFICDTCLAKLGNLWPRLKDGSISDVKEINPYFEYCPQCGTPSIEYIELDKERTLFFTFFPKSYKVGEIVKSDNYFKNLYNRPDIKTPISDLIITSISFVKTFKIKGEEDIHLYEIVCKNIESPIIS